MEYKFSDKINEMLKNLEEQIMKEYDSSKEVGVRVNLMPKSNNTMSQYEHIIDNSEVIARMNEKLGELQVELAGCTSRMESFKAEGKDEEAEKEDKIAERLQF